MQEQNIKTIRYNPELKGMAEILPDITYSRATGKELKLTAITPWRNREKETEVPKYPLILFVQGSGWTFPNIYYEIPQLCDYAKKGYVVATVTHRNCLDGNPFPAFLQDVKTAVRFFRKNAGEYGIDPERIGIWGTSSGGNTALLVGLTKDHPKYGTEEYTEYSDGVKCIVDCFGPTDVRILYEMIRSFQDEFAMGVMNGLSGGKRLEDHPELLEEISPVSWVKKGKEYPPFLLLHGDADRLVPFEQSVRMYQTLVEAGVSAEMVRVENAPHEGSFWSSQVHEIIMEFFNKNL